MRKNTATLEEKQQQQFRVDRKIMVKSREFYNMNVLAIPIFDPVTRQHIGGYRELELAKAKQFFRQQFPEYFTKVSSKFLIFLFDFRFFGAYLFLLSLLDDEDNLSLSKEDIGRIQTCLWRICCNDSNIKRKALALLCLRCYVSHAIISCTKQLTHRRYNYTDLLPFVLNDDGRILVVLQTVKTDKKDEIHQLALEEDGKTRPIHKETWFYSIEIIKKYKFESNDSLSLYNWAYKLTGQCSKLRKFMQDFSCGLPSDWALLCRGIPSLLKSSFSNYETTIVKVFRQVYCPYIINHHQHGLYYPQPNFEQQEEICRILKEKYSIHLDVEKLKSEHLLENIANRLRNFQPKTPPSDIPPKYLEDIPNPLLEDEFDEIINLAEECIYGATASSISQRIEYLRSRPRLTHYADFYLEWLRLFYHEENPLSLTEIDNRYRNTPGTARRVLSLKELIGKIEIKTITEQSFIKKLQKELKQSWLKMTSENFNEFIENFAEPVIKYLKEIAISPAEKELKDNVKRPKRSLIAHLIRKYLEEKYLEENNH